MSDVQRTYYVLVDIPELKAKAGEIICVTEGKAATFSDRQLMLFHVAHRNGLVGDDGRPVAQEPAPPLYTGLSLKDWDKKVEERKKTIVENREKAKSKNKNKKER
jgi:hypothetical protein